MSPTAKSNTLKVLTAFVSLIALVAASNTDAASASTGNLISSKQATSSQNQNSSPEKKQTAFTSFLLATSMILVSEVGDKTFLIAALMAMKNNRYVVFSASIASLAIMTLLSGIFGQAFTTFLPETLISWVASILFFVFGFKILKEGLEMDKNAGVEEELHEVEEELASTEMNESYNLAENGGSLGTYYNSNKFKNFSEVVKVKINQIFSPLFVQVFVMVFLGEIGDRSQISTIVMAGSGHFWAVIFGSILGHACCSAVAVIFGVLLASKIKMRTVTLIGGALFLIFGLVYLLEALS
ncbi:hypothetical protein QEN19_002060 [Hanseniaspora menglaensis]